MRRPGATTIPQAIALAASLLSAGSARAYVTRDADVWHVACRLLPVIEEPDSPPPVFALLTAAGDPDALAIPESPAAGDTPVLHNLARARDDARARLEEFAVEHEMEILERRLQDVVAPGEVVIRLYGEEAVRLLPLDPASTPGTAAFAGDVDEAVREIFRCRQSGTDHDIDPTLVALLAEASYFFQAPVELVSGYRARRFSRRKGSRHIQGRAADIRLEDVPMDVLADFLTVLSDGPYGPLGVGRYPRDGFVHVDTRDETHLWTDRGRSGRRRGGRR